MRTFITQWLLPLHDCSSRRLAAGSLSWHVTSAADTSAMVVSLKRLFHAADHFIFLGVFAENSPRLPEVPLRRLLARPRGGAGRGEAEVRAAVVVAEELR